MNTFIKRKEPQKHT